MTAADHPLLRAWLDGSIGPEDHERFEAWLGSDDEHLRQLLRASAMEAQLEQLVADRVGGDAALQERPAVSDELGEELVEAYLQGDLATAEMGRLQQYLQCDVHRLRRLVREAAFEYDLHQQVSARVESDRYEPSTDQTPLRLPASGLPLSDRRPRGTWWQRPATAYAAAGVLLAAALLLWVVAPPADRVRSETRSAPPEVHVAQDHASQPSALPAASDDERAQARLRGARCRLLRAGREFIVGAPVALRPGDRIRVDPRGHAELALDDGSLVLIAGGSELRWLPGAGTTLDLARGALEIAAAEQDPGSPLRVRSAGAVATVVGTVFAVESDGARSLFSVREGEVELAHGARRLAVRAGATAAADESGLHLLARASNWLGADLPGKSGGAAGMLPFVDLMRYARPWNNRYADEIPEDERRPLALDAEGWIARLEPGQHATSVILHGGAYPAGVYTCLYEGEGLIEFGYGTNVIRSERGRLEVDVTPTPHGVLLHLVETDPDDPVRNIRLVMPGFERSHREDPFNPRFVEALRGVGVVRTHAWLETRTGGWLSWSQRRRPGDGPGDGSPREAVALEEVLALVERLDCDLWLTAPHNADDSWFAGLGAMLAARLPAGRTCYLEYSSEIWNGLFSRVQWCREQGESLGYPTKDAAVFFANDRSEALWQAVGSRLGPGHELVRVLSYHDVGAFRDPQQAHGRAFELADALAVYGGIRGTLGVGYDAEGLAAADRDALLDEVRDRAARAIADLADAPGLTRRYGKRVLAYRAGAMFWAAGEVGVESYHPISQRAGAIARDPAMAQLLGRWLEAWRREVGDVAIVPLGGHYARGLREDTPARERWARTPLGPSWWAFHRALQPVAPFPPSPAALPGPSAPPEF